MSDWENFESEVRSNSNPLRSRCTLALLLEKMDPNDAKHLQAALDNETLTSSGIHRAMKIRVDPGLLPCESVVRRHRRGACSCPDVK